MQATSSLSSLNLGLSSRLVSDVDVRSMNSSDLANWEALPHSVINTEGTIETRRISLNIESEPPRKAS